jgi:hypothetical protein
LVEPTHKGMQVLTHLVFYKIILHIDDIYKKACSRLLLLRQVNHLLDRYSLIRINFAFIRPVLEYGASVSHPNSWYSFCLEEIHLRPVIIRPASICTLSNKSDSFFVQLPHTTSPYSKTGLLAYINDIVNDINNDIRFLQMILPYL